MSSPSPEPPSPHVLVGVLEQLACVAFRREMLADGTVRYPYLSPDAARIFGVEADALTVGRRGALNIVHWADREGQVAVLRRSAETGETAHESFRTITADGETRWFRGAAVPRRCEDGRVEWEGVWHDVTQWVRVQFEHQTLLDHADDCIVTIGNHGIEWANAATERMFGWSLEEMRGLCLGELFVEPCPKGCTHPCPIEGVMQCFPRGAQEVTAARPDGTQFPFEMTVSEVRRDGRLSLIVIGRDVTRRKVTEMLLEESERRLRSIASNLPGIVFQRSIDDDGGYSYPYVSEGVREILGDEPVSFMLDRTLLADAMLPEDRARLNEALARSARTMAPVREDTRVRGADRRVRWLRGQSRPRRRDDTVVWDGVLLDVTDEVEERLRNEEALRESEERLRMAFSAASFGIAVIALDGAIQYYNPALRAMTGRTDDQLWGASFFDFVEPTHFPAIDEPPPPGTSFQMDYEPHLPSGEGRQWCITATQFSVSGGDQAPWLLLFIEDITEVARAAADRRQMELALQEGQKLEALGRLAGGVAHELNNMLGPILMGAEMIARTAALDERNRDRVDRIIDAAKTGRDIVRNVLAYCRKEQHVLERIDLVPVFRQFALLAASVLPPTIKVEATAEAEAAVVEADSGLVNQILLNLANNARDAMGGHGTLTLTLAIHSPRALLPQRPRQPGRPLPPEAAERNPLAGLDASLPYVEIACADTGCGMSPATVAKIFDPFFTTKPVGRGTGLGLSVVQGIVKMLKGAIAVDSEPGRGTVFRLLLPVAVDAPAGLQAHAFAAISGDRPQKGAR
jgi:PAS domain S-box-containing protein